MSGDVTIDQWDFETGFAYGEIDGKRIAIPFRTADDGGQRPKAEVEEGAMPIWQWDGDREEPTLSPSVRMLGAHFHVKNGEVVPT